MLSYMQRINKELDDLLEPFVRYKMSSSHNENNNSGYGYLSSSRCNTHTLSDGSYIKEGISFSAAKGASVPYFCHYDSQGNLIKKYK